MEQLLCEKVVMLCQKDLKITDANKNKHEAIFKFQGRSLRSHCWFDIDFDWIEVNFSTLETELYGRIFQRYDNTQDTNIFKIF